MAECSVVAEAPSALAALFSRENAQAYEPQPPRHVKVVRRSANHALKSLRKQFTTASGLPFIDFADITGAECFVCPPFTKTGADGRGQEGIIDIDSEPDYFNWREFLAFGLQTDQLDDVLSSPVYRVTIEHTGEKVTRHFVIGTDRGCPDAKDWELRFWRQDQKVVRCTVSLDGKPAKYTIESFGVNWSPAPGPPQGGQRWVGAREGRRQGTRFLFGGLEEEAFISYLRGRVEDRDGFNIKFGVVPYEDSLPDRVKELIGTIHSLLPSDMLYVAGLTQPALAAGAPADVANEGTQDALAAGKPSQPALAASEGTQDALAAGELAQPALALNEGTQDALAAGEPAQPALAAIEGFQDAPAAGVPTQPAPAADEPSQWHGDDTVGNRDTGTGVRWGTQSYGEINWGSWSGGGWGRDGWSSDTGQTRHDDSQGRQGSTSHSGRWTRKEWDERRVRMVGWLG